MDMRVLFERVRTVSDMAEAFRDEEECRRILERMVWPQGRICPQCGSLRSYALAGRDTGRKARPGLYQCAEAECRTQFTATTRTPMHATKLPIRTWLQALWVALQADKGISSPRLAELIGVTQATAWRMGHALRLMMAPHRDARLDGVVEADEVLVGGAPRKDPSNPGARRGKQGHTTKRPVLVMIERPESRAPDPAAAPTGTERDGTLPGPGKARALPIPGLATDDLREPLTGAIAPTAHLMTDRSKTMAALGTGFAAHDNVNHTDLEFSRGIVHANSAEGLNDRIRRTVVGIYHHISQAHVARYLDEVSFRWEQRVCVGTAPRRTRKGHVKMRRLYDRIPPVRQMATLLSGAVGREFRRTRNGSLNVLSTQPVFGM